MLAQVQTHAPLHFNKPFILVTRIGENESNDTYLNPRQQYYEFDTMEMLFNYAARGMSKEQKPLTALRINTMWSPTDNYAVENFDNHAETSYFHDFPTALEEYKNGVRRAAVPK